jgi:type I restriction enzyme S subunit
LQDKWIDDTEEHITEQAVAASSAKVLPAHTVLVAMYGATVGQLGILRRPMTCNQACSALIVDPTEADYRHLFFQLLHVRSQLKGLATGAAQQNLSGVLIKSLRFPFPPLPEQHAIAHILGTLDDKIELNRRMNETLEAMARALFKSWFVDFDPVRAKAEGRDPGLPQPLADLFPACLVDSELGEIPEGWGASKLGSEVVTVLGGTPSRAVPAYWGGDIPWINSGKANEFRVVEPSEFITQEGLESSATKLLPSRTTVIAITGATLGQISLVEIETCANQSIVGVLGTATLPSEFIYFWTKEHVEDLLAWQTGGAQQHINKNNVNDLPVLCPSDSAMASYLAVARPAFDRIKECCNESRALAALRDALLPKLISGELRVKDAEMFIGRAV